MIYLDNAATTFPKPDAVYEVMDKINRSCAVNAGRGSYRVAREAEMIIQETKQQIRNLIHADITAAVVFAPSITIALNQIVNGLQLKDGSVVYMTPYEHNAVARTVYQLGKKKNIVIKEIPINENSLEIDLEQMKYEFSKDKPSVLFCTHISNVTGYVLPVEEIFREAKKHDCINILDAAQSMGLLDINVNIINVDIVAFAGHKSLYGPFGIGGFVNLSGISLDVFLAGGTGSDSLNLEMPERKEIGYEPASNNIIAIAGLNAALSKLEPNKIYQHEIEITNYLIEELSKNRYVRVISYNGIGKQIGIVSFIYEKMKSEDVGMILDEDYDIAVRTGYHCAPFIHKYLNDEKSLGTVRVGIGQFTTKQDIKSLVDAIKEL